MNFNFEELKRQVSTVLKKSQGLDGEVKVDLLLDNWYKNKSDFISCFGDKLIWECPIPVSFPICDEKKRDLVDIFAHEAFCYTCNKRLWNFISANKDGFFDNKVVSSNISEIPKGMKLLRSFKYFIPNEELLHQVQDRASQIIQQDKITGTFCLSVHPLDFLSLSENNYKWRSCHALDGEYCAGNLSYMQDSSTIIAYIRGDNKNVLLPNFPDEVTWNDKKWRMLIFLSDCWDMIFAGRQYPFAISGLLDWLRAECLPQTLIFNINNWTPWSNTQFREFLLKTEDQPEQYTTYRTQEPMIPAGSKLRAITEVIKDCENPMHYNDLLYSSCYIPYYMFKKDFSKRPVNSAPPQFHIGHELKCLHCEQNTIAVKHERANNRFYCDDCYGEFYTQSLNQIVLSFSNFHKN